MLPRRVYVREKLGIAKYWVSAGCPGCAAITAGGTPQGYSAECRARIELAMRDDADGEGARRLERASKRRREAGEGGGPMDTSGSNDPGIHQQQRGERRELEMPSTPAAVRARLPEPRREVREFEGEREQLRAIRFKTSDGDLTAVGAEELPEKEQTVLEMVIDAIQTVMFQLGNFDEHVDVPELFGPGRFAEKASAFRLLPGTAFDLRAGWDLATASGRQACWRLLDDERPVLVIGSPPCTLR